MDMPYFDENNLERMQWHCSLNVDKYFTDPIRGKYNKSDEYVVTWYKNYLSFKKSNALVEVTFNNLIHPTFSNKDNKMSSFRHVTANKTKNNWVWNGIKKLL